MAITSQERLPCFTSFFHTSLRLLNLITRGGTPQPLGSYALCQELIASLLTYLWLRREIFTRMSSKTWENRSNPSDHAAVRLVIRKPTPRGHLGKRIPSWMSTLNKAKNLTIRELSRKTPDSIGAKLLIASTALRAYRHRHLGTLMRCCEAWKPIEDCFDTSSFECVDFQRLSQIIANLTRETLPEREAERAIPWKTKMNQEGDCEYWRTIFQARVEGPRHHQHEDILRYVQQALHDISWTLDQAEFALL